MLGETTQVFNNVTVESFDGLLVDFAERKQAAAIVRGIRAVSDYEIELQMAHLNRHLRPQTETIFLPASAQFAFLSSRMIKEIIHLGGDVRQLVPEPVWQRLERKWQTS